MPEVAVGGSPEAGSSNAGSRTSKMQGYLYRMLYTAMHPSGYEMWVEQRVRTRSDPPRYRVPDVCVTLGEPAEDVFTAPPFLCAEVLSPDDTAVGVRAKIDEYLTFGVSYVWVIDTTARGGEIHTRSGIQRVDDGRFTAGAIEIDIRQA